jgi:hypothetical protein
MQRHAAAKQQEEYEQDAANQAAYESQSQLADMQTQMNAIQAQQSAPAAPAAPPAAGADDTMAQLKQLADMKTSGLLTDEEFAAAKAKLLG